MNAPATVRNNSAYSLDNARRFSWSSVTGELHPERRSHLERHIVGQKVLDAGCGGGAYAHFLSLKGLEVTGVDIHEEFLQVARQEGRLGTYVRASIDDLPFADKTFDTSYCFDVLEHVDDRRAVRELVRVTRRRVIVAVPLRDDDLARCGVTFAHYQDMTHLRTYTKASIRELFAPLPGARLDVYSELDVPAASVVRSLLATAGEGRSRPPFRRRAVTFVLRALGPFAAYRSVPTSLVVVADLETGVQTGP